jgi:hypothetical protein
MISARRRSTVHRLTAIEGGRVRAACIWCWVLAAATAGCESGGGDDTSEVLDAGPPPIPRDAGAEDARPVEDPEAGSTDAPDTGARSRTDAGSAADGGEGPAADAEPAPLEDAGLGPSGDAGEGAEPDAGSVEADAAGGPADAGPDPEPDAGLCVPADETCDGADEDCDGVVDEGCCRAVDERCDGEDNDCDGIADEALVRPCADAVGDCVGGQQTCTDGAWGACDGPGPGVEICGGGDEDCDGAVDEGIADVVVELPLDAREDWRRPRLFAVDGGVAVTLLRDAPGTDNFLWIGVWALDGEVRAPFRSVLRSSVGARPMVAPVSGGFLVAGVERVFDLPDIGCADAEQDYIYRLDGAGDPVEAIGCRERAFPEEASRLSDAFERGRQLLGHPGGVIEVAHLQATYGRLGVHDVVVQVDARPAGAAPLATRFPIVVPECPVPCLPFDVAFSRDGLVVGATDGVRPIIQNTDAVGAPVGERVELEGPPVAPIFVRNRDARWAVWGTEPVRLGIRDGDRWVSGEMDHVPGEAIALTYDNGPIIWSRAGDTVYTTRTGLGVPPQMPVAVTRERGEVWHDDDASRVLAPVGAVSLGQRHAWLQNDGRHQLRLHIGSALGCDGAPMCEAQEAPGVCDLDDQDCDGRIDEGVEPPMGVCPSFSPGACAAGRFEDCRTCVAAAEPAPEAACYEVDSDCNGLDDDLAPTELARPEPVPVDPFFCADPAYDNLCGGGLTATPIYAQYFTDPMGQRLSLRVEDVDLHDTYLLRVARAGAADGPLISAHTARNPLRWTAIGVGEGETWVAIAARPRTGALPRRDGYLAVQQVSLEAGAVGAPLEIPLPDGMDPLLPTVLVEPDGLTVAWEAGDDIWRARIDRAGEVLEPAAVWQTRAWGPQLVRTPAGALAAFTRDPGPPLPDERFRDPIPGERQVVVLRLGGDAPEQIVGRVRTEHYWDSSRERPTTLPPPRPAVIPGPDESLVVWPTNPLNGPPLQSATLDAEGALVGEPPEPSFSSPLRPHSTTLAPVGVAVDDRFWVATATRGLWILGRGRNLRIQSFPELRTVTGWGRVDGGLEVFGQAQDGWIARAVYPSCN